MPKCGHCNRVLEKSKFYKTGSYCKRCMATIKRVNKKKSLCIVCHKGKRTDGNKYCKNCSILANNPQLLNRLTKLRMEIENRRHKRSQPAATIPEYDQDDMGIVNHLFQRYGRPPTQNEVDAFKATLDDPWK